MQCRDQILTVVVADEIVECVGEAPCLKLLHLVIIVSLQADILGWRNNLAYAVDRRSWNKIKKCSKVRYTPW